MPSEFESSTTVQIQRCLYRLQNGEDTARDELIQVAEDRLTHLTRKMFHRNIRLRALEETGDVFQEAIPKLWKSLKDVTPDTPRDFFGLAALQIRRTLIDMARTRFRDNGVGANQVYFGQPGDESAPAFDPPDHTQPKDLDWWTAFHEAVDKLAEKQREVVNLRYYHGCTWQDVADTLDISDRTARVRWLTALVQLKKLIGEDLSAL